MGRSVSVPSGAVETAYLDVTWLEESDDWEDFIYFLQQVIRDKYPSFIECKKWLDREDQVVLENQHAYVVVCGYGNVASISLVAKEHDADDAAFYLAKRWAEQVGASFLKTIHKAYPSHSLGRLGTFSNGESVYQKVGA